MRKNIILLLLLGFTGCVAASVTTSVTKLDSKKYSPLKQEDVTVYITSDDIKCDYSKIALIHMKTELDLKEELLINEARKKAAQQGANGVIIEKIEEPNTGTKVASALFGTAAN